MFFSQVREMSKSDLLGEHFLLLSIELLEVKTLASIFHWPTLVRLIDERYSFVCPVQPVQLCLGPREGRASRQA